MLRRFILTFVAMLAILFGPAIISSAQAGVQIRVDLNSQRMTVTTPDGEVRNWAISSGRQGYRTIRGSYRPYMLKTHHVSRKYGGAMPHAIFFKGGYAIHGTSAVNRLGRPASHGCIRLAPGNARELFHLVKRHGQGSTRIAINGTAPDQGRTMVASAKKRNGAVVARSSQQRQLSIPAYAPIDVMPGHVPFRRLR
jgi:L,D-transpeptidase catalytic domain